MFLSTIFMSSLRICIGGLSGSGCFWEWRKWVAASTPSRCGMLVYSEETSMLTSKLFVGIVVFEISLTKFLVSWMYDGSSLTIGCSQWSTNLEMFSVMLLTLETIGLIPIGFLRIFLRKYSLAVLCDCGGLQDSTMSLCIIV